jgi:hypothetical protein
LQKIYLPKLSVVSLISKLIWIVIKRISDHHVGIPEIGENFKRKEDLELLIG